MISVIIFDLDDTLYPEREFQLSGFRAVDRWLASSQNINGFYNHAAKQFEQGTRRNVFDRALNQMRVTYNRALIDRMVDEFRRHQPIIELYEDAEWALQQVGNMGYRSGLITDGHARTQANKIKALGLETRLDLIIATDELGSEHWKPHPLAFQMVMQRFGCQPDECVYIGDNPSKDFIAAKELGWSTVRVRRGTGEHAEVDALAAFEAKRTICSLFDLAILQDVR